MWQPWLSLLLLVLGRASGCARVAGTLDCRDLVHPPPLGDDLLVLVFGNVSVPGGGVTATTLSGAPGLRRLSWTRSDIADLAGDAFSVARDLENITLADNRLGSLAPGTFAGLRRLRGLDLSGNLLVSLPRGVFADLAALASLDLGRNRLGALPYRVLDPCRALVRLDLGRNALDALPDSVFAATAVLQEVVLAGNRLRQLPPRLFRGLRELRRLALRENRVKAIPGGFFRDLVDLRDLDISSNALGALSPAAFQGLGALARLNLSRNPLEELPGGVWHQVPGLLVLDLAGTRVQLLRERDLRGLGRLRELDLRQGELREIEHGAFQETTHLVRLDLAGNDLAFLPRSLVHLSQLRSLDLDGNPWACDCRMLWFATWIRDHVNLASFANRYHCGDGDDDLDMMTALGGLNCTGPRPTRVSPTRELVIRSPVLLECDFAGNPAPTLTWVTPRLEVFHWNPDPGFADAFDGHPRVHWYGADGDVGDRVSLLENGSLFIRELLREDVGRYKCFASNPLANATTWIVIRMDPVTYFRIKIFSIVAGAAAALGFLAATILVQLVLWILLK